MKGFAYASIILLLLLLSSSIFIISISESLLKRGTSGWKSVREYSRVIESLEEKWEACVDGETAPIFENLEEREEYYIKDTKGFFSEGNLALLGEAIFVKGIAPLSIFPDLKLNDFPSSEEIINSVFGEPELIQISDTFYTIKGKREGIYVSGNSHITGKDGKALISSSGQDIEAKSFIVVDGQCNISGEADFVLLCSGPIKTENFASQKTVLISSGEGFFKDYFGDSRITIKGGGTLKAELLAESVIFQGEGILEGGIQAMRVQGEWKLRRKPEEIDYYPRMEFPEETLAFSKFSLSEVEK